MVARRTPVGAHIFVLASLAKTSCWDWVGLQVLWQDFLTFFSWIDVCVWSIVGKSDMTGKDQSWALTTLPSSTTTAWCRLKIYCPYKRCFCNLTKRKSTSSKTCWTDQTIFELSGPILFSLHSQISLQDLGFEDLGIKITSRPPKLIWNHLFRVKIFCSKLV